MVAFGCVSFPWRKKASSQPEDEQPFPRLRKRADVPSSNDSESGRLRQIGSGLMVKDGGVDMQRRIIPGKASPVVIRGNFLLKESSDRMKRHELGIRNQSATAIEGLQRISKLELSFEEVIRATKNFAPKYLIGRGGFGSVYKGVLTGGRVVAVKRMDRGNHHLHRIRQMGGADRLLPNQLVSELEVLARVQCRHLVNLVGYAIGVGAGAGDDKTSSAIAAAGGHRSELVLVYDYMPNGSLYGHLHGKHSNNNSLDWTTRLKIALDVAEGINYLHHICKPPIIHRDIKAGNVLLNKEYVACVADFGLSKLLGHTDIGPDGQAHVTDMSNDVKGTFGYVDPTYILTRQIAPKSDVYSYGILLLELLTGRKPLDQLSLPASDDEDDVGPGRRVDARVGLAEWAISRIGKERIEEIIDAKLAGKYDVEVAGRVGELAASCVNPDRDLRPAMARVVAILTQLLNGMSNAGEEGEKKPAHDVAPAEPADVSPEKEEHVKPTREEKAAETEKDLPVNGKADSNKTATSPTSLANGHAIANTTETTAGSDSDSYESFEDARDPTAQQTPGAVRSDTDVKKREGKVGKVEGQTAKPKSNSKESKSTELIEAEAKSEVK